MAKHKTHIKRIINRKKIDRWTKPGGRGLDLCFFICGIPRVMWITKTSRYCLYWSRGNTRSNRWLSFERQAKLRLDR